MAKVTMVEAINMAHAWEMAHDPTVVVLGACAGSGVGGRASFERPPGAAMPVVEKILRLELLNGGVEDVVFDQDGAEHAAFGFYVLRQGTFESRISHGSMVRLIFAQKRRWAQSFPISLRAREIMARAR